MSYRGFRVDPTTPVADRVLYYVAVDVTTRCWRWLGALDPNGYGMTTIGGRPYKAHRVSYETFVGPVPDGLQLDHLCRVRCCVNPEHLEPVTAQVNVRRGMSIGAIACRRTACINGHPYAEHSVMYAGRRRCRRCNVEYLRAYQQRRREERAAYWAARGIGEQVPA